MDEAALNALLAMHNAKAQPAPKAAPLMPGFMSANAEDQSMSPLATGVKQ